MTRFRRINSIIVLLILMGSVTAAWSKSRYSVDQLTAAFMYNISKFVKWPTADTHEVNFCILGEKQKIAPILRAIIAKKSKTKHIEVLEFTDLQDLNLFQKTDGCHLLFFESDRFSTKQVSVNRKETLLVGRSVEFLQEGGMLSLVLEKNKMTVYVNNNALNRSSIRLGSRLMLIAKAVE